MNIKSFKVIFPALRRRRPSFSLSSHTLHTSTRYTIGPPTKDETLALKTLLKRNHSNKLNFLAGHILPEHTKIAFGELTDVLAELLTIPGKPTNIILDHGCGTAKSTYFLSSEYPDHLVIGIDRSIERLQKNRSFEDSNLFRDESFNVILVRAELSSFFILFKKFMAETSSYNLTHHKIFYPNPYPKTKRMSSRLYGHSSFLLLLELGGEIEVRSNWLHFINHTALAVNEYDRLEDRTVRNHENFIVDESTRGVSRFEEKYLKVGEVCHGVKFASSQVNYRDVPR